MTLPGQALQAVVGGAAIAFGDRPLLAQRGLLVALLQYVDARRDALGEAQLDQPQQGLRDLDLLVQQGGALAGLGRLDHRDQEVARQVRSQLLGIRDIGQQGLCRRVFTIRQCAADIQRQIAVDADRAAVGPVAVGDLLAAQVRGDRQGRAAIGRGLCESCLRGLHRALCLTQGGVLAQRLLQRRRDASRDRVAPPQTLGHRLGVGGGGRRTEAGGLGEGRRIRSISDGHAGAKQSGREQAGNTQR